MLCVQTKGYIRATALTGIDRFILGRNGNADGLFSRCGIRAGQIDPNVLVPFQSFSRLLETAATDLGMPCFGLDLAAAASPAFPNAGAIPLLALLSRDLGEWIAAATSSLPRHTDAFSLVAPAASNGRATLRLDFHGPVLAGRQTSEHLMALTVLMMRSFLDADSFKPVLVRFIHPAPANDTPIRTFFDCPVEFGSDHVEVVMADSCLSVPVINDPRLFRRIVDQFIRSRLECLPQADQSVSAMVTAAVGGLLGGGHCTLELVAAILGMHEKKLRRLLAQEGTNFALLFDRARCQQAAHLLRNTAVPVSTIARLVDYTTLSAFSCAFRRWFGDTPRNYRNRTVAELASSAKPVAAAVA